MRIIVEVLNKSQFSSESIFSETIEGTEDYCNGYVDAVTALNPNNIVLSREL